MDSRNSTVRWAYFKFCSWGVRTPVLFENPYKGGPTPMWANISKEVFGRLSKVSIIFLFVVIGDMIYIEAAFRNTSIKRHEAGKPEEDTHYTCYKNCIISYYVNIVSMCVNFAYYSYLEGIKFASDQRWSQYMFILGVNIIFQSIGAIIAAFLVVSEQVSMMETCFELMKLIYIRQYIWTMVNFGIIVTQITSLVKMFIKFKYNTAENFYY